MARTQRTKAELRAASDHLYYEIQMLRGTMKLLATGTIGQLLSNALIESFTVHTRTLIHFLYPSRPYPTDVLAEDFFNAGDWVKNRPDEPEEFRAVRDRVNKEIAHLTYDRQIVTPELKGWNFVALGNEILEIMQFFMGAIPKQLLGSRWQQVDSENCSDTNMAPLEVDKKFITVVSTPGNV
jgi:hypothetical protein